MTRPDEAVAALLTAYLQEQRGELTDLLMRVVFNPQEWLGVTQTLVERCADLMRRHKQEWTEEMLGDSPAGDRWAAQVLNLALRGDRNAVRLHILRRALALSSPDAQQWQEATEAVAFLLTGVATLEAHRLLTSLGSES